MALVQRNHDQHGPTAMDVRPGVGCLREGCIGHTVLFQSDLVRVVCVANEAESKPGNDASRGVYSLSVHIHAIKIRWSSFGSNFVEYASTVDLDWTHETPLCPTVVCHSFKGYISKETSHTDVKKQSMFVTFQSKAP